MSLQSSAAEPSAAVKAGASSGMPPPTQMSRMMTGVSNGLYKYVVAWTILNIRTGLPVQTKANAKQERKFFAKKNRRLRLACVLSVRWVIHSRVFLCAWRNFYLGSGDCDIARKTIS